MSEPAVATVRHDEKERVLSIATAESEKFPLVSFYRVTVAVIQDGWVDLELKYSAIFHSTKQSQ